MKKIRVLLVIGTRPEGIKMCPLIKSFEKDERFEPIVCVTAQHREMLDEVLRIFNIKQDYDLNVMKHGQTIIEISNKVLYGVDKVIKESNPDIILVHGDTTTTLNGALAGLYNKIPVGHIEAGLRTYDIYSPFPEEANRKITSTIATIHFAPTELNKRNLLREGIKEEKIFVTGNTVIDALVSVINKNIIFEESILNNIDYENKKVILLTTHRRENWGSPMENIFKAIIKIINEDENVEVIFPIHKNPLIRNIAYQYLGSYGEKVHLIEPLEYVEFANLMAKVTVIMTDSGGIQEEAPTLGKPVIVLRTETERPEAIDAGTIKLVGIDMENIYSEVKELLNNQEAYKAMAHAENPYGDGNSCKKILENLWNVLNSNKIKLEEQITLH